MQQKCSLVYVESTFAGQFKFILTLSQMANLDSSKLKDFADDNFKLDKNGEKLSKRVENAVGKRRNCLLPAISPFPTVFSKDLFCRHVKTRA